MVPTTTPLLQPCDACGCDHYKPGLAGHDVRVGVPGTFQLWRCTTCGLVSLQPQPTFAELDAHYPDWLWEREIDPEVALHRVKAGIERRKFRRALRLLRRQITAGRLLDVGCATGGFVQMAVHQGWKARGLEVSSGQVEVARARGLDVELWADFTHYRSSTVYDAITFNHVLEHVPSPRAYLQHATELLRPGGIILVSVPNYDSLSRRLFGAHWMHLDLPRHLFHFSPASLSRLFDALDCDVLETSFSDRDQNALGLRHSALHRMKHGVLRRPAQAETTLADGAATSPSVLTRTARAGSNVAAAITEGLGVADTFSIVARPRRRPSRN